VASSDGIPRWSRLNKLDNCLVFWVGYSWDFLFAHCKRLKKLFGAKPKENQTRNKEKYESTNGKWKKRRYMCWLISFAMSIADRSYLQLGQLCCGCCFAPTLSGAPQWQQKYVRVCPRLDNSATNSSTVSGREGFSLIFFRAASAFSFALATTEGSVLVVKNSHLRFCT